MSLFLAVIGATAAALLEVMPYIAVGAAHPHPVLVFGLIWVVAAGIEGALVWAFVGGIALDALASRPLGLSSFALLVAVGLGGLLSRALLRIRPLVPILAVALLSGLYSIVQLVLLGAIRSPIPIADPLPALIPGVAYDIVLAVIFGPLAVAIRDRYAEQERLDW
jgi:rod shape-determining protein MreD